MYRQNDLDMISIIATTNNLTVSRMAVIGMRTGSELMAGAKAMMIENLKRQMRNGVAHFVFQKKDGTLREAFGTLDSSLISRYINGNGCSRECFATTAFFDCQKAAWRSFRWENLVAVL